MTLALHDPRKFSQIFPDSNILINQAMHDLTHNDSSTLMQALIEDILKQKQDQTLSVAYNLAPNLAISNYIWDNLQEVLNHNNQTQFFVIPIVIVAGSKQQVSLNLDVPVAALKELFVSRQLINSTDEIQIANKLYDLDALAKIKPSELYLAAHTEFAVNNFHNVDSYIKPLLNIGEGVHLRFILAYANPLNVIFANFDKLSMDLMQFISNIIKIDNATLFPIPFPPCELSVATVQGEHYRKEIQLTVLLSNEIKKLRLNGKNPEIKLSSQKNNIQVEIWLSGASAAEETLIWNLQPADNFTQVCEILEVLFTDMQLTVSYYPEHHHED